MAKATEGKQVCKWLVVKKAIEQAIINGDLPQGSQLPTLEQLTEKYGIGRSTAWRVLNELDQDGLIMRKGGQGCFVRPFVRERVRNTHKDEARSELAQSVSRALAAGIPAEDIEKIVTGVVAAD